VFYTIRAKIIASFLSVTLLAGLVSLVVGGQLLYRTVLQQASTRVALDLNAARGVYQSRVGEMGIMLRQAAVPEEFAAELASRDTLALIARLRRTAVDSRLDFAGIVTPGGSTLCRLGPDSLARSARAVANPLVAAALVRNAAVSGTVVLSPELLRAEDPRLAERARVQVVEGLGGGPEASETAGLALGVAVPLRVAGHLAGILYGGVLLNRSEVLVDSIGQVVYPEADGRRQRVGGASVLLRDVRVATSLTDANGRRAVGTRESPQVRQRVLTDGSPFTERSVVLDDRYITACEPLTDIFGDRVGMLCVSLREAEYAPVRRKALAVLVALTLAGMGFAVGLGCALANKIMRPVQQLIRASVEVSGGNLTPTLMPPSSGEIGVLERTFADMVSSLQERERRQHAESEVKLLRSEKQASIGRLAAGVAHEINNPLTGVLTFTHMLLRRDDLNDSVRADLETIARETDRVRRIVRGLLDFARETRLHEEPAELNTLVRATVSLVANQALIRGIRLDSHLAEGLPVRSLDRSQMQSVLMNLLLNAIDATSPGGTITVTTALAPSPDGAGGNGLALAVRDTGCGIPPQNLARLFEPFFTTKEPGRGTGLGLSVSQGIVERHGGVLLVESQVGQGSTFTIWLPVAA
jgi:two-component system NtrC family sensor kinase